MIKARFGFDGGKVMILPEVGEFLGMSAHLAAKIVIREIPKLKTGRVAIGLYLVSLPLQNHRGSLRNKLTPGEVRARSRRIAGACKRRLQQFAIAEAGSPEEFSPSFPCILHCLKDDWDTRSL